MPVIEHALDPVSLTELAIIERLKLGLGKMVKSVGSYGGELEPETVAESIRSFPAAWVTFGGVNETRPLGGSKDKFRCTGTFVVMVGARNVRNEAASRHGGASLGEVGSYQLVRAVRRLLTRQDLDLPIDPLTPTCVRTLFNTVIERDAFSVFACEFRAEWVEAALELGHWPEHNAPGADGLFTTYQGQTEQAGILTDIRLNYHLQPDSDGQPEATDVVITESQS